MSTLSTSATSQSAVQRPPPPPRQGSGQDRMASTIGTELSSGALSSTDATALTSALTSINSSLSAANTASGSSATAADSSQSTLDPASMKDRIDSLIADQVSSGALTSDQATELTNLFASGGQSTSATASADGASGGFGPPPGPPPSGAPDSGSSSTSATSASDLLSTFMQQLQASQSRNTGYDASGTTGSTSKSALLIDFRS